MTDLDRTFRDAERAPVTDLWPKIVTRTPGRLPPAGRGGRVATIVVALVIAVGAFVFAAGVFDHDASAPAGPSPTAPPAPPRDLAISYNAAHLMIRGVDPHTGSGFSIKFYGGRTEQVCLALSFSEPSQTQLGHPPFETITRCAPGMTVGDGVALGPFVMLFVPPGTTSATARLSDGSLVDADVLRPPQRFLGRASSALDEDITVKIVMVSRSEGVRGDLIVRDASGRSGTLPVTGKGYGRIHDQRWRPVFP